MKEIKNWKDLTGFMKPYKRKSILIQAVELKEDVTIHTRDGILKGRKGDLISIDDQKKLCLHKRKTFFRIYESCDAHVSQEVVGGKE